MRTINTILRDRLVAQAEEADVQGLYKVAEHITSKIEKTSIRDSKASYTYSSMDFKNDVESILWDTVVRFADFHNISLDASVAQDIVEKTAEELIKELQVKSGVEHGVGAFEPTVPGENRKTVILDVEDE